MWKIYALIPLMALHIGACETSSQRTTNAEVQHLIDSLDGDLIYRDTRNTVVFPRGEYFVVYMETEAGAVAHYFYKL